VTSIQQQRMPAEEIIVVADADEALHRRVGQELPEVRAVLASGPAGLSGARNAGVAAASADVVAFLDDDAIAAPDWLARLAGRYEDGVVAVGGAIEPDWLQGRPPWFPEEFDWVVGCTYRGSPTRTTAVRNLIGANMSFRLDVVREAGGFRDGIGRVGTTPTGCEETELCIRVRRRIPGSRMLFDPGARVRHRVPPRRATWAYYWRRCWAEGRSKALVAGSHGAGAALEVERAYTSRVLPAAARRALRAAVSGRDRAGLQRAGAIAGGLAVTGAGYVVGSARVRAARA
jgi:glycosyltransferase involved in cell wall biosynthesis